MRSAVGMRVALLVIVCSLGLACTDAKPPESPSAPGSLDTLISIGVLEDLDGGTFEADPSHAAATKDGGVAFVDGHDQRVVVFDSMARRAQTLGRRGQGPGEFQHLERIVALGGDTLVAFDRTRQAASYVTGGVLSNESVDFRAWRFAENSGLQLVGRFGDGRWVGLLEAPRFVSRVGARITVDTPRLVVGSSSEPPREFIRLAPRRFVDVLANGRSIRVELPIAPSVGAVCERGVVTIDTTGVRRFGVQGEPISSHPIPVSSFSIEQIGGRVAVLFSAMRDVPVGPEYDLAKNALHRWLSSADSSMNNALIDANGHTWFVDPRSRVSEFVQVDENGKRVRAVNAKGPILIGERTWMTLGVDEVQETMILSLFRRSSGNENRVAKFGWCGTPFRY